MPITFNIAITLAARRIAATLPNPLTDDDLARLTPEVLVMLYRWADNLTLEEKHQVWLAALLHRRLTVNDLLSADES